MQIWIMSLFMGLGMGGLTAFFGALKDMNYEKFKWKKFVRSPILTEVWFLILLFAYPPSSHIGLVLLSSVTLERITIEIWKAGIRKKKPSKFKDGENRDTKWIEEYDFD